jgi:phage protein D
MRNDVPASAAGRQPRGMAYGNGERLAGVVSFQVDNNSFYQADTFRIVLALSEQPKERGFDWWSKQQAIEIELLAGFPADLEATKRSDLESLLIGNADDIEIDPVAAEIVISGRDLTSKLIDVKRSVSFITDPLLPSDVVRQIAKEVGLNPVVVDTDAPVGGYYQIVKAIVEANSTYWDIVTRLAQVSNFVAYVKGRDLHFEPREKLASDPYVIHWDAANDDRAFPVLNAMRLRLSRNLSISKDIRVRVVSYDQKQKREIVAIAEKKRVRNKVTKGAGASSEPPVEYTRAFPNMKHDQAQAKANALLAELSQHEMNMHVDLPGDSILSTRMLIKLSGTGSDFDQAYFPSSIVRTFSLSDGYRMELTAKNQSPDSEISQ